MNTDKDLDLAWRMIPMKQFQTYKCDGPLRVIKKHPTNEIFKIIFFKCHGETNTIQLAPASLFRVTQ